MFAKAASLKSLFPLVLGRVTPVLAIGPGRVRTKGRMDPYDERFGGVARLFGAGGLARLRQAHVCVVGLGGVGSWAVEALARSGLGALTLVDFDTVCRANTNRQIHALDGEWDKPKAKVLARRVAAINPDCQVQAQVLAFSAATADRLLQTRFDFVVDAIDQTANKCLLIAGCCQRGLPIVTIGGAAGRRDPTQVRVTDLAFSAYDGLLDQVRTRLRREYGFPRGKTPFGVECVFSPEPALYPSPEESEAEPARPERGSARPRRSLLGTAAFVTGAFGFTAAAVVVRKLVQAAGSR